ncbi:MAG: TetR/AcrR family transcriptional regulator [Gammaproteobacteria bacterium]|nr:TetR/AcrR family transcriptional regulator [Gammaproteobacteria bacterium]MDH3535206.1 TetR/AcrR family transcriptional regulator [Gammaproteobacteria bacterium]
MSDNRLLKAVAERGFQSQDRKQLQRFDWLQQALETFVSEGIDAVRITRLADDLGVTRGSFYWHFENRNDLIEALVSYWIDKNTDAIVRSVDGAASLAQGIFRFFETCIDAVAFDPRLDLAIREWSRRSPKIRRLVDREDAARIASLQAFFTRFEYPMPDALVRARVLYYSQIGFYALEIQEPLATRLGYTEAYFECFTGRRLDPGAATAFCRHIIDTYGGKLT